MAVLNKETKRAIECLLDIVKRRLADNDGLQEQVLYRLTSGDTLVQHFAHILINKLETDLEEITPLINSLLEACEEYHSWFPKE